MVGIPMGTVCVQFLDDLLVPVLNEVATCIVSQDKKKRLNQLQFSSVLYHKILQMNNICRLLSVYKWFPLTDSGNIST